ncbi:hypothetical protein GQ53DRAFT_241397 [Thozetella sp. PMI_491]|nr:hypothetical protein GQ53DRAFT_241397 [Thozetella sp. PMI_491]
MQALGRLGGRWQRRAAAIGHGSCQGSLALGDGETESGPPHPSIEHKSTFEARYRAVCGRAGCNNKPDGARCCTVLTPPVVAALSMESMEQLGTRTSLIAPLGALWLVATDMAGTGWRALASFLFGGSWPPRLPERGGRGPRVSPAWVDRILRAEQQFAALPPVPTKAPPDRGFGE